MKMSSVKNHGFEMVTLKGPLDIETVAEMKDDFEALTARASSGVVLDMTGVTFMDSSGVGALVFMYKRLTAQQATMHLVGLNGQPQKLIKLLRIHQTIPTHTHISDVSALPSVAAVQGV
jgi:anti-anti-sigma factor